MLGLAARAGQDKVLGRGIYAVLAQPLPPLCSPDTWAYHPQSWSEALTSTLKRGPPITQHCLWHRCGVPCLPLAWADPHQLAMLLPSRDGCEGDRMIERFGLGLRITPTLHKPIRPHG